MRNDLCSFFLRFYDDKMPRNRVDWTSSYDERKQETYTEL